MLGNLESKVKLDLLGKEKSLMLDREGLKIDLVPLLGSFRRLMTTPLLLNLELRLLENRLINCLIHLGNVL